MIVMPLNSKEILSPPLKFWASAKRLSNHTPFSSDKLNGEPGVYTGRYAGEHANQIENLTKLLNNLKQYTNINDRTAKFVCVLTAILPSGEKIVARGECEGSIAFEHGKLGGLTYGPVFVPKGFNKPMGDMDDKEFASVHSHRDLAMEILINKFKELEL